LHNELIGACLALTKKRTSKADSAVSLVEMWFYHILSSYSIPGYLWGFL
jgi:hypothetical protein